MNNSLPAIIILLLLCLQARADGSDIVKCVQPDGSVVYTNMGCDNGKEEVVVNEITIVDKPKDVKNHSSLNLPRLDNIQTILSIYALMSLVCYFLYWIDKKRSIDGEWRIQESTLHLFELLGGWPGAFVAQRVLRHKNRKVSYQTVFWVIVFIHLLLWLDYFSGSTVAGILSDIL